MGTGRSGWTVVAGLSITELVSWGVLVYAFSAFLVPMVAETGWPPAALTTAYAVGVGVSGAAAVPVGRWLVRHSVRWLMTAGSALTVIVLLGWSRVSSVPAFFGVFALAGLAMAATLYEPAFVLTTRWFTTHRARAVLVVTVLAGFASTVFVPLAGTLSVAWGWRTALVVFAAVVGVVALPIHAFVLRDRPAREPSAAAAPSGRVARRASFWWIAVALAATTAAKNGLTVVMVAYLVARGYGLGPATLTAGVLGAAQVGGRVLVTVLGRWMPVRYAYAGVFAGQALACLVPLTTTGSGRVATVSLVVFVVLLGAGFGLAELLRGTVVVDYFGIADFPRVNGLLATWVVTARAAGPLVAGAVVAVGGYGVVLIGAGVLCGVGAVALPAAHRAHLLGSA